MLNICIIKINRISLCSTLILNVKNAIMKKILLSFLFCFAAMLYAAPPEATPASPNDLVQILIQKAQPVEVIQAQKEISNFVFHSQANHTGAHENNQILQPSFWRQNGKQSLIYANLFPFSATNAPLLYHRLSLANKVIFNTKTTLSFPRYLWQYSKRLSQKTR